MQSIGHDLASGFQFKGTGLLSIQMLHTTAMFSQQITNLHLDSILKGHFFQFTVQFLCDIDKFTSFSFINQYKRWVTGSLNTICALSFLFIQHCQHSCTVKQGWYWPKREINDKERKKNKQKRPTGITGFITMTLYVMLMSYGVFYLVLFSLCHLILHRPLINDNVIYHSNRTQAISWISRQSRCIWEVIAPSG
jgi:hypothetical protein